MNTAEMIYFGFSAAFIIFCMTPEIKAWLEPLRKNKIPFKTGLTVYEADLELEELDENSTPRSFIGQKVKIRHTSEGNWSKETYTITKYIENTCGDGCCDGFKVKGQQSEVSDLVYWPTDLLLVGNEEE